MIGIDRQDLVELCESHIRVARFQKLQGQSSPQVDVLGIGGQETLWQIAASKDAIERSGIKNTPETLAADRKKFRDAFAVTSITSPIGQKVAFTADRETPKSGVNLIVKNGQFVAWKEKS